MSQSSALQPHPSQELLQSLGQQIRAHRKALKINATVAAQSAGVSRVTWHRIENGESSVSMGSYAQAAVVLGLSLTVGG